VTFKRFIACLGLVPGLGRVPGKVYKGSETPYKRDTLPTSTYNYTTIGKYIIHGYGGKPSPIDN